MVANNQTRMGRKQQKKSINQSTKKKPLMKKILMTILIVFLTLGIGVLALFTYYIATAPKIDAAKLSDPFSSKVYDQNGEEFADLGSVKRTKIEYDDLPDVLIDAVTATEDARFFEHHGIDLRRIGGAIIANIKHGFGSEGASTITQQVIEKAFLTPEKSIKLKVQEQWLALKLERRYSKEQILEMYLNKIFYGSGAYGVARAAEVYFGKTDLHELTLPEAAILAGLPQRPTAYNPYENPDLTKKRMQTVLKLMVRHGKITQEQADEASKVDVTSLLAGQRPESIPYEAFIQQVRKEVSEKIEGADIYTDGLKIYTTLNRDAQDYVEFLLKDSEENPINYPNEYMQSGMVVLETKTGAIEAIGGRRNSQGIDEYNYAIQGEYQAASTAKPIMAYGPAIEYDKWSTYHQLNDDKPYEVAGSTPIQNWNRQYQGWMSARYALAQSLNVPAVKTLEEIGFDKAKQFAEGLGIEFYEDMIDIRDAIGGAKTEVSPLQLAGAYQAFGNEGIYIEPYTVTKVEFPDGKVVELTPEPKAAMSDYTAYMITDMLKSVVREGTGTLANVSGLPVAGKTGTTTFDDRPGSPDSWFVGYTTNYTISVWSGNYDEENNRDAIPDGYTRISQDLFRYTMTEVSKNIETPDFTMPNSVVKVPVEKGSNPPAIPSEYTPDSQIVTELFVKGTEPSKTSEKYDKLGPVKGLQAIYDEPSDTIKIEWKYDSEADVSFEVSASINGGQMQKLSTTDDYTLDISQVEPDSTYDIQVVVISKEDSSQRSEPKSTKVKTKGDKNKDKDNDEPDDNDGVDHFPPVNGLHAKYKDSIIHVKWNYNGSPAVFEVSVNGQVQTVSSYGIDISGAQPGVTYTISVTPISQADGNIRGDARSVQITIEGQQEPPPNDEPDNDQDQDQDDKEESDE